MRSIAPAALVLAGLLASGCAAHVAPLLPQPPAHPEIRVLDAGRGTHAYVVMGAKPILVDTGWGDETAKIEKELTKNGVDPKSLALIVLTHGHGDHAGGAARLRAISGAKILAGKGDVAMVEAGENRPLHPTGALGRMLEPFSMRKFPAFIPDEEVAETVDLAPYGIGGRIVPAPGHTPGSLMVVLDDGDALVGDMLRGSLIAPESPRRHFFHDDCQQAESYLAGLVSNGTTRLYVGHGGPLDAKAAAARVASHPCTENSR